MHSCCQAERPIPAYHHASGNAFFRSPLAICRACLSAYSPRSVGSTASGQYYADDRPSFFLAAPDTNHRTIRFTKDWHWSFACVDESSCFIVSSFARRGLGCGLGHVADDSLATFTHRRVLYRYFLLTTGPGPFERFHLRCVSPCEFVERAFGAVLLRYVVDMSESGIAPANVEIGRAALLALSR